jgi:membrane protein implicated in regulation of membrane protease activity
MKTRVMVIVMFLGAATFTVLGLLFLLRLHYKFFGFSFLVLGAVNFFIAERYRRKIAMEKPPNPPLDGGESENHAHL